MDKHDDDDVAVSGAAESSRNATVLVAGETLDENLGCGGDEGGELMVEVVGSDVFFDGVSGVEMGGNGNLRVRGDGDVNDRVREGGVEIGVDGLGEIAGSSSDKVVLKRFGVSVNEDVVMEEVGIVAKEGDDEEDVTVKEDVVEEDVTVVVNEGGLERVKEVIGRDDVSCMLATSSACGDSDLHVDAMNCDTKVVEEDVKVVVTEDSEKCEEVTERDGVSCEVATLSACEDSIMHGDAMNCASEVDEEEAKVAVHDDALGRGENVIGRDDVSCELATTSAYEDIGMPGDAVTGVDKVGAGDTLVVTESSRVNTHIVAEKLASVANENGTEAVKSPGEVFENQMMPNIGVLGDEASDAHVLDVVGSLDKNVETANRTGLIEGVVKEGVKVAVSEGGLERVEEVTEKDVVSHMLATPSARENSDMHGDAMNFDTKVVEEDVKVVVNEDSEKCKEVTDRDGVSCTLTITPAREDTDMQADAMNCASEVVEEDPKIAPNEDTFKRDVNVIERVDVSCELATTFAHKDSCIHGDVVNGADEVGAGDAFLGTRSYNGDTCVVAEKLASVAKEDSAEEAVKLSGELLENHVTPEIGVLGDKTSDALALDDIDSLDKSDETAKRTGLIEGDCNIDEGTQTSVDLVTTIEHSEIVTGSTEAIDSKVSNSGRDVISEDHKILTTESEGMLIENTDCAGANELKVEALCGSSRSDVALCSDPESGGKQILVDNKLILNDNLLAIHPSEVDRRATICPDTGKYFEQVNIPETDVSGASFKEAIDSKDNGAVADASNDNLSSYVERVTIDNSSENDVALGTYPVSSSQENHDADVATVMSKNVAESNMEVSITVMDIISGSEDIQIAKCDPSEKDGDVPMNEENFDKQAVDGVEKALTSALNDVGNSESFPSEDQPMKGQGDMEMLVKGIVVAGADTTVLDDEVKLSDSKIKVLNGDQCVAEKNNMNSKLASGIDPMAEENKDEVQNSDVKQSGTLISDDDPDKVFNQLPTELLDKGDSDPNEEDKGAYVSEGTSNEDVNLEVERNVNEPTVGSLIGNSDTCSGEEGKKSQGPHLEEDISLPYDPSNIDSNVQKTEGDFNLQIPEGLDATSTRNFVEVSSDQDHILKVEEGYNEENQVDIHKLQETDVLDKAMEIEPSEDFDEKFSDQMSPEDGSVFSDCHSNYLLPPINEGEFSASDLVWGKVRSHPWWPGQICNPSDASEKAMKYHKKDRFLVSYFGDRTFAWNDASWLRPFRTHFYQIKEQNNSETFHHAVNCALAEVSRRVELGLACSCIPKNSFADIESQILENAGIRQEAGRRYGVDESSAASCFEPEELLEHIRSLAVFPSAGSNVLLQLVLSKAQLSAFSRFKGHCPLPDFQLCGGLLENDAVTDRIQQHGEKIKSENNFSSKRNHDFVDSLLPRKKERSVSDLMKDKPHSSDADDQLDSNIEDKFVASSSGLKRKALDSVTDESDKRQSYYAAKVSTTSQTPKPSFKIGECIRRVASQLTGSPSLVKSNSEKFLKVDDSVEQHLGFDDALQTPVDSQREGMMLSPEHSALAEILSQLHLAAQDPMKGYSFLKNITSFFSDFRQSVASGHSSRMRNLSTGRGGRKKKAPHSIMNSPEGFEFDDVNDSYWTDRIVQNYGEDELPNIAQNGEADYQLVLQEANNKPVKSSRRSRKQFSNGEHLEVAEEPVVEPIDKKQDCSPTELILNFSAGHSLPTELNLNKIFRRFGPLRECETEVDRETRRARVVYKRCSDAEVALSSAGNFNIFGPMHVIYELSYVPSAPYKPLPVAALEGELNASSFI